ncbi:MAG: DMT family transporter [Ilumatobacteraceae bacterium]
MVGRPTQRHGWLWCAAAAALFGAATPSTKLLVDDVGAVALAGLLYLGAAVAVAPFTIRERQPLPTLGQRSRLFLAVVVGGGVAPVLLVLALDRTPAGTVSLLLNLELVATAVIARAFLHEHIGRRAVIGVVMIVVGTIALTGTSGTRLAPGALLVAGACLCWGIDNAITASLDAYSPKRITLAKGLVAGSVNLALGIALAGLPSTRVVLVALAIGVLGYGLSITLWITGARLVGAARGQAIFALAPFVGALLAWPINGDALTAKLFVAFAVSLAGVALVGTAHHVHYHKHSVIQHAHPIDADDPHHSSDVIEIIDGEHHRHLAFAHGHEHLPDIHHRHEHDA